MYFYPPASGTVVTHPSAQKILLEAGMLEDTHENAAREAVTAPSLLNATPAFFSSIPTPKEVHPPMSVKLSS